MAKKHRKQRACKLRGNMFELSKMFRKYLNFTTTITAVNNLIYLGSNEVWTVQLPA